MANELPDYSYYDAVLKYLELKYEPYHHNKRAEKPPDNNGGDIDYSYYEAVLKYHELTWEILQQKYPELRGNGQNYIKDEKGRFAGSRPGSGSGSAAAKKSGLTKGSKGGKIPLDKKGKPFKYPSVDIPSNEYNHFIHNVNTYFHRRYVGKKLCTYYSGLYSKLYYFENHGFDDYNIYKTGDIK